MQNTLEMVIEMTADWLRHIRINESPAAYIERARSTRLACIGEDGTT